MIKLLGKFVSTVINHDLRESQGEKFFFAKGRRFYREDRVFAFAAFAEKYKNSFPVYLKK
ncbi:MAG TPA: hypothetical protein DDZ11_06225 [Lentisphaeria bacterium]|nr:hypothetical protein [Lentisphaeria bacterium]